MIVADVSGAGRPLALLHGLGSGRKVWHRVTPALAASRRVIALDLPGFGDSPPVGDGFDLARVGAAVAERAAELGGDEVDLVGHSLGGAVAIGAARAGAPVRSLVLVAPAGFGRVPGPLAVAAGIAAEPALAVRRLVAGPLAGAGAARRVLLAGAVADGARLAETDARLIIDSSGRATRLRAAVAAVASLDLEPELAKLACVTGVIRGDRDRVVSLAAARRAATAGRAALERIPDAGHIPQLERPADFVAALERSLAARAVTDS